jgi:hypothetical protein
MEKSRNAVGNSASVSIRKAPVQKYATDTNEHEKAQIPTLSLEALRGIARITKAIKSRLARQADGPVDTRIATSPDGGSPGTNCQNGSQGNEGTKQEKQ